MSETRFSLDFLIVALCGFDFSLFSMTWGSQYHILLANIKYMSEAERKLDINE